MFHNFNYDELLNMIPFEYDAICSMVSGYLETQQMKQRQEQLNRG